MVDAGAILERVRSLGANILSDGGKLIVVNREKLPAKAIEIVKQHGHEIAQLLDREAEVEEREAIIQHDGGLTRPIAEYLTRLLMSSVPEGAEPADWTWFVGQAAQIIDRAPLRRVS